MWKLKQSGQFKKDLRKYQNDREKMKSLERVLVQLSEKGKVDKRYDTKRNDPNAAFLTIHRISHRPQPLKIHKVHRLPISGKHSLEFWCQLLLRHL